MASQLPFIYRARHIQISFGVSGEVYNQAINVDHIPISVTNSGLFVQGRNISASGKIVVSVNVSNTITSHGTFYVQPVRRSSSYSATELGAGRNNWIWWSKIGYLSFVIDEANEAGKRPLDWPGTVYSILKLDQMAVAYGENGISLLRPSGVSWGLQTISNLGIKCKTAVTGNEREHYFIDKKSRLHKLSKEGPELFDYSEFLGQMANPSMALDPETGLIYICDGTLGFVFSTNSKSLGEGPVNITGAGSQSGFSFITASGDVEMPKFEICTDIYDFGTRKPKTVKWIEIGTDLTDKLQAMVEFRVHNKAPFTRTPWKLVNPSGIAYTPCYGAEFRVRLRSFIKEYFEIDYVKITGVVHGGSYLDSYGE